MKLIISLVFVLSIQVALGQLGNASLMISFKNSMGNFYENYITINTTSTNIWHVMLNLQNQLL